MSKASIMLWPVSRGSLGREFHSLGPTTERRNNKKAVLSQGIRAMPL